MTPAEQVERALQAARTARAEGALDHAQHVLHEIASAIEALDDDHPLRQIVAWRAAKIAHDRAKPGQALELLAPLLFTDADPFEHYPAGLSACAALTEAAWGQLGYRHPTVRRLWERASQAYEERGDPYLAATARVQLAWDYACGGDLGELAAVVIHFDEMPPRAFEGGPSRHPRAADAMTSLAWLQLDVARTQIRACTWRGTHTHLDAAVDLFETAADDAGLDRATAYWFLEPLALARLRLERPDPDDYVSAWLDLAPTLTHPRAAYHRAIARAMGAWVRSDQPERAAATLRDASRLASAGHFGAEWEIDPARHATALDGQPDPAAATRIEQLSVHIFPIEGATDAR